MRFVDTNVFIYVLVKSPRTVYETSKVILKRIENGEEALVTLAVLQEVVDWLEYNRRKNEVETFVKAVNSYIALQKLPNTWNDFLEAPKDVEEYSIDFVDALTVRAMRGMGVDEIYSTDTDFDRVKGLRRVFE